MDRVLKRLIKEARSAKKNAADWNALKMIKRQPGITKDPEIAAWYEQMGCERKVVQRVFELLDVYRMSEEEVSCLLNCLTYHSNRCNLYPIKLKKKGS